MKALKPVKLALPVCAGIVLMTAQFGISSVAYAAAKCPSRYRSGHERRSRWHVSAAV